MAALLAAVAGGGASLAGTAPAAALAGPPVFGIALNLGAAGGEPSITDDGHGHVYISSPNGILSSIPQSGVGFWRSDDGGATFHATQNVGGLFGGEDSDVVTDPAGNVYVADLAVVGANVIKSTDHGQTFDAGTLTGFVNDREWLTAMPDSQTVFLTYHDLVTNAPEIYKSTDGGNTFLPAGWMGTGQVVPPSDPGFADTKCNTLVSKPVVDGSGAIYVLINTATAAENVAAGCAAPPPALERFYVAVSTDGGSTFTTHLASDLSKATTGKANDGSWGHVFNQLAIDAAGNLYIDASGTLDGSLPLQNYLLVSTDHGVTWSKPIATRPSHNGQLFPAIATGQAGQVAVGYYQGTKADHHADHSNFQFVVDETMDATDANPAFSRVELKPLKGVTPQPDGICTDGIFCGTPLSGGGNRNLADFESMTVDPTGHLEIVIPADSDGSTTENWYYKQTGGPLLRPGAVNGNGTGGQTWASASAASSASPTPSTAPSATPKPAPPGPIGGLPNTSGAPAPGGMLPALLLLTTGLLLAARGRRGRGSTRRR
jgi:BNR/Asp-box repeat